MASDDVLHLGQEPAVNLSNASRFSQLDRVHQQKDAKYYRYFKKCLLKRFSFGKPLLAGM